MRCFMNNNYPLEINGRVNVNSGEAENPNRLNSAPGSSLIHRFSYTATSTASAAPVFRDSALRQHH